MALQETLDGPQPQAFLVTLSVAGERLHISPYALLPGLGGALLCLDAPRPYSTAAQPVEEWLQQGIDQRGPDPERPASAATASARLLTSALDALLGLCELGGQMHDPGLLRRTRALAVLLESAGLRPAALLTAAVVSAGEEQRPQAVLLAVHALGGMLQLLRLPAG
jgi:hypothetical protein